MEFDARVQAWVKTGMQPKLGVQYVELVYQSMRELFDYLRGKPPPTNALIDSAAPATWAAEFRRQFSLVARKMALRICGPAIITNAIGRIFTRLTAEPPFRDQSGFACQR